MGPMSLRRLFPLLALGLAACRPAPQQLYKFDRPLMHTRWDFSVVAPSQAEAQGAFEEAASEVERLDKALAMWRPDSELAAFNAQAGKGPQKVSPELDEIMQLGQKTSVLSNGASDCSVGPLVQLWYDSLKAQRLPAPAALAEALKHVDYRRVTRTADGLWSEEAGMRYDLGSFAKGYVQDKVAAVFRRHGIKNFLMNAGGQVYAAGLKPDGSKWSVGILNPRNSQKMVAIMQLADQSMSTSGDYEQFTIIKGKRYHHIMDPHTGWPVTNGVASVTVLFPIVGTEAPGSGSWCDALDTAALVSGMQKGKALLQSRGASGVLIHEGADGRLDADVTDDLKGKVTLTLD
jgi:thiamine biosynthesis lipoprotein